MSRNKDIHGMLLLDKPLNISSNAALQRVRWLYSAKKAGHTGALDPLASGLLPICFGETTKFSDYFLEGDKGYLVTAHLGVRTTTSDREGEVVMERPVPELTLGQLEDIINQNFVGDLQQRPSIWSALKYQGKPLYEYARKGIEVPRPVRNITIYECKILKWEAPYLTMQVECSKGTYIRTLVDDLGELIGCGAHVSSLHRNKVFGLEHLTPISLEQVEQLHAEGKEQEMLDLLMPLDFPTLTLPQLTIDNFNTWKLCQGMIVIKPGTKKDLEYRAYHEEFGFLGVVKAIRDDRIRAFRMLSYAGNFAQQLKEQYNFKNVKSNRQQFHDHPDRHERDTHRKHKNDEEVNNSHLERTEKPNIQVVKTGQAPEAPRKLKFKKPESASSLEQETATTTAQVAPATTETTSNAVTIDATPNKEVA